MWSAISEICQYQELTKNVFVSPTCKKSLENDLLPSPSGFSFNLTGSNSDMKLDRVFGIGTRVGFAKNSMLMILSFKRS